MAQSAGVGPPRVLLLSLLLALSLMVLLVLLLLALMLLVPLLLLLLLLIQKPGLDASRPPFKSKRGQNFVPDKKRGSVKLGTQKMFPGEQQIVKHAVSR